MFAVCPMTRFAHRRYGGSERHVNRVGPLQRAQQRLFSAAFALRSSRDVDVFQTRRFEREADEFASTLNRRPVVQLVDRRLRQRHGTPPKRILIQGATRRAGSPVIGSTWRAQPPVLSVRSLLQRPLPP